MHTPPPSRRHRLSVPISTEVLEIYSELARVSGKSMGAVIADWLQDTASTAQITISKIEAIRREPEQAMERFEAALERAEHIAEMALERAQFEHPELDLEPDDDSYPEPGSKAALGSKLDLTPPSSNTGGKVGKTSKTGRVQK